MDSHFPYNVQLYSSLWKENNKLLGAEGILIKQHEKGVPNMGLFKSKAVKRLSMANKVFMQNATVTEKGFLHSLLVCNTCGRKLYIPFNSFVNPPPEIAAKYTAFMAYRHQSNGETYCTAGCHIGGCAGRLVQFKAVPCYRLIKE